MSLIKEILAASTAATNAATQLTAVITNKVTKIDAAVNETFTMLNAWKTTAFTSPEAKNSVSPGCEKLLDLSHLSANLFYPVIINKGHVHRVCDYEISRYYSAPGPELGGVFLRFSFVGHTWGGNPISIVIERNQQTYRLMAAALGLANYYHPVIFLRGGYEYNLISNKSNIEYVLYDVKSRYYHEELRPQYDSYIGPVDEATAIASAGGLTLGPVYNKEHTNFIANLGGE
jgi:hypothetical protein